MSRLESRLEETMAERARVIGPAGFTADEIFQAGRRLRSRRRRTTLAAAAAGVVAIAVVSVTALPLGGPGNGVNQPAGTPTPSAPTPSAPPTGSPALLDYALGTTIVRRSGGSVTVPLPAGYTISGGQRVPTGWVVEAYHEEQGFDVWWQPDGGTPRNLGRAWGSWKVAADGSTLVIAGLPSGTVTAYELPSGQQVAQTSFGGTTGPVVLAATRDHALLREASGDSTPTIAGVWDLATNTVSRTAEPVGVWPPVSDAGEVVVRFANTCMTVVDLTEVASAEAGGTCNTVTEPDYVRGAISPDGHVLVTSGETSYLVRGADLRAGVWAPVATVSGILRIAAWDTGSTFFAYSDDLQLRHCQSLTDCSPVDLPTGAEPMLGPS